MIARLLAAAACVALFITVAHTQAFNAGDEDQSRYVDGNLYFLAYHEVGHMIMDQVMDAEQQADRRNAEENADDIAVWLMLPDADEPELDDQIWAAMEGWQRISELRDGIGQSPHYPDDATRAARIACYLYGTRPGLYKELAKVYATTISSVDCAEEVKALQADMQDWFGDAMIPPAEQGEDVRIEYQAAPADLAAARDYLMKSQVLEDVAEDIAQFIHLPNEVLIVAKSCGHGEAEFRYSEAERKITACYEAVDWLMGDAAGEELYIEQHGTKAPGDELGSGSPRISRRPRPPGR